MAVYAIGQLTIHNTDWMAEYGPRIAKLFEEHQGKVIARGEPTQLEGSADLPNVLISIEFPNREAAIGWYNDPENQELVKLRQQGSNFELLLVDGMS